MWRWVALVGALAPGGCGPSVSAPSDTDGGTDTGTGSPEGEACDEPGAVLRWGDCGTCICADNGAWACSRSSCGIAPRLTWSIDILFVVDNSLGMTTAQSRLAAAAGVLTQALDASDADYRIAVTTTDNGNPWCSGVPEGGNFVMRSCRERESEFIPEGTGPNLPQFHACTDVCELDMLEVVPSEHDVLPAGERPWLDVIAGVPNIANGSTAQALACMIPQGLHGCGFEAPLESMYRALARTGVETEPNFGFGEINRWLAILFLTDEVDCSHAQDSIFDVDGDRVFWSDPAAELPTSAVCWNAGVACDGGPGTYDDCTAVDRGVDGRPPPDLQDAALHPVSRYIDQLRDIELDRQALDPSHELVVAVIAGVGPDGELVYADSSDPQVQGEFGVGFGCVAPDGETRGLPPVRLREVAEALGTTDGPLLESICAEDYAPAMQRFAEAITPDMSGCWFGCAADLDRDTPGMQVLCALEALIPTTEGLVRVDVPPCTEAGELPGPDDDSCYTLRVNDDLPPTCAEYGWNVAFDLTRRPGVPLVGGMAWDPTCVHSEQIELDCPDL